MTAQEGPPVDLDGFRASMREAGIEEIVEPTLRVFVREASALFSDMDTAVSSGDVEAVRAAAHTLKSSAGSIWAADLADRFKNLELVAREGDAAGVTKVFEELRPSFAAVMESLAEYGAAE